MENIANKPKNDNLGVRTIYDPIPDYYNGNCSVAVTSLNGSVGMIAATSAHEVEQRIGQHIAILTGDYRVLRRFYGINLDAVKLISLSAERMNRGEVIRLETLLQDTAQMLEGIQRFKDFFTSLP